MISIVLPVYQSARIVGTTLDAVVETCVREGWPHEVLAIDDASRDGSLEVLQAAARRHPAVRVIALPVNVGQQAALPVGLAASSGEVVVCMDDDLQHPPSAIPLLVQAVQRGHDAVFARFAHPRHATWRRLGSLVVRGLDRLVFGAPASLQVTSFRALSRTVVDRVCAYRGTSPYVRGQILLASRTPANVDVEHQTRGGASSYGMWALIGVVVRVLLEWSRIPSVAALGAGALYLTVSGVLIASGPPWARAVCGPLVAAYGGVLAGLGLVGLRQAEKRRITSHQLERDDPYVRGRGMQALEAGVVVQSIGHQAPSSLHQLIVEARDAARREEWPARGRDQAHADRPGPNRDEPQAPR